MKTMRCVVMCAAFALGALSVGAEPVARIGETDYGTLEEAVAVGGEVRLLTDATVEWLQVPPETDVVLDLAGHTLTGTREDRATVFVKGSLTIDDSVGGGRITHDGAVRNVGHAASQASAVCNVGSLALLNGVICDCEGDCATIRNAGRFYMSGGAVSNCTATACGGVQNYGDFVFAGGAIVDCRGEYGAVANNGAVNNVSCTMLMTGGLVARCCSTVDSWVVFGFYSLTIQDGTFEDCGPKAIGGGWDDAIVIAGGRFDGGIVVNTMRRNTVTVTGGVYAQSAHESVRWDLVLPLGYECVANADELTAQDYPWAVAKVFTPLAPGESVEGIVAEDEAAALAAVRVNITDANAIRYDQERLIKKIATRQPDGTWTITLGIDTSAEGYVEPDVTLAAIASQLTKVAETKPSRQTAVMLPAEALTVGLHYWIEECGEVGGEWRQVGCQMATGKALTYCLFGSDGRSRYFRVGQSLSRR